LLRRIVEEALRAARDVMRELSRGGLAGEPMERGAYGDVSYRGDLAAEKAVIEVLRSRLGSVTVVSEEMGVMSVGGGQPKYWALLDPIDGSANMSRGIAFFSSGLALAEGPRVKDVVCSGIIDHASGEVFVREGDYTSHSIERERHSREGGSEAVIFHHASIKKEPLASGVSHKVIERLRFFRVMGSALLEICYAALGRVDAYICVTPELRLMDIVPAAYFADGVGAVCFTHPTGLLGDTLTSRSRYGVIVGMRGGLVGEILAILGGGWAECSWGGSIQD